MAFESHSAADKTDADIGHCSNHKAVLNVILTAVGVGIVTLPKVVGECGWIGGSTVLLSTALITIYSTWLLFYAITQNPSGTKVSFPDLAHSLFGSKMKWFVSINIYGTLCGICAVLLVIIGKSVAKLANADPQVDQLWWRMFAISAGVLSMPLTWLKSMNEIGPVSAFGVVTLAGFIVVVVVAALLDFIDPEVSSILKGHRYLLSSTEAPPFTLYAKNYLESFSTAFVSYFMASCVPTLIKDMRTPSSFPKVSIMGNGAVCLLYFILCLSCYAAWGNSNTMSVLDMLNREVINGEVQLTGKSIMSRVANSLIILTGIPHLIALLLPMSVAVDPLSEKLGKRIPCAYIFGRSTVVILIIGISLISGDVDKLVLLIGSLTIVTLSVFLPVLFYVRVKHLKREAIPIVEKLQLIALVLLGVMVMVVSLTFQMIKLLQPQV